ncbi:MAG: PAS domain S-box protein [Deltaproteobacteria bacterium]|nr:PAS domain S-box protein [Deltaproteobacteria bacterium]
MPLSPGDKNLALVAMNRVVAIVAVWLVAVMSRLRQQASAREAGREARWRTLLETAVDGIIVIDDAGTIQIYNPACVKLFGYAPEETVGKKYPDADAATLSA